MRLNILIFLFSLTAATNLYATKVCPRSECINEDGFFDKGLCSTKADWVAVGSVVVLAQESNGYPLNNVSYTFRLNPDYFEKGQSSNDELIFNTGWCSNQVTSELITGQKIRLYGLYENGQDNSFLYYEAVETR